MRFSRLLPELGAPLVAARFPRAYLDVNREPWELDPTMFADALPNYVNIRSPRVRMGLGRSPRGGERQRNLCPQAALRRGANAGGDAVPSVPPCVAHTGARYRGRVRRLSSDRLPFDAVGRERRRRAGPGRCRARGLPWHGLRAGDHRGGTIVSDAARLCGRAQRALCRRLYDGDTAIRGAAVTRCRSRSTGRCTWTSGAAAANRNWRGSRRK